MHPSLMPSFFAPPMPFHPEELYKHVKELERLYGSIPAPDTNARTAQAKAIISANDSFLEGCLMSLFRQVVGELGVPEPLKDRVLRKLRGLSDKLQFAKELAPLRGACQVKQDPNSNFVEGQLAALRNKVDHGDVVSQVDLRLDGVDYFRLTICAYLEQVYASLGVPRGDGWASRGNAERAAQQPDEPDEAGASNGASQVIWGCSADHTVRLINWSPMHAERDLHESN